MKGRTTCALIGHAEYGVSLYGLRRDEPRLTDAWHERENEREHAEREGAIHGP